jgi:hypothetical protein
MRTVFFTRLAALFGLLVSLSATTAPGTFTFSVNGTPVASKVSPASTFTMMNVITLTAETPKVDLMLEIYRKDFPKLPLTIPIDGTSTNAKGFYYPEKMLPGTKPYFIAKSGTLTITRYDAATRTISGTFSFKGERFDPMKLKSFPGDNVSVTNGVFESVTFKKL